MQSSQNKKHITCSIVGMANVGKSTLLNSLIQYKLAITTDKPQTTRKSIKGITIHNETQIIFIDTPGIFDKNHSNILQKNILKNAWDNLKICDVILLVVDAEMNHNQDSVHDKIFKNAEKYNIPVVLVINKADRGKIENRMKTAERLYEKYKLQHVFYISAKTQANCQNLMNYLSNIAQHEGFLYDEELISDQKPEEIMTEFIREYFFEKMGLEIPYGMHIEIEEKQETEELMIYNVIIYVKKDNHKKIVIGKDAINLKNAISHAILHTQELFPKPLKIKIFVKVDTSWIKNLKQ